MVKGSFEATTLRRKRLARSSCVTSEELSNHSVQNNHTDIPTPKQPSVVNELYLAQPCNISPTLKNNKVPPQASGTQEVIVGFKTFNDHIVRVTGNSGEPGTLSPLPAEKKRNSAPPQRHNSKPEVKREGVGSKVKHKLQRIRHGFTPLRTAEVWGQRVSHPLLPPVIPPQTSVLPAAVMMRTTQTPSATRGPGPRPLLHV